MAGKPIRMSKIKQLLHIRRTQPKMSLQEIGDIINMDRGTISSYLQKIADNGFEIGELLAMDDMTLESTFHSGNPAYLEDKFLEFKALIPYFENELKKKHVTQKLLWQEYKEQHPNGYGRSQFCFHLSQLKVARKGTSAILTHSPAREIYVDFAGDKLSYTDQASGEIISVEVFVAVLPYSNYTFAMAVPSQKTEDFVFAITKCFRHLSGVPAILVPDNLKAAVIKTDRYEPSLNKVLEDLANHYSMALIPCRPYHPKDKSNVEKGVHLTYQRVYARLRNITFFSLADLNKAIAEKVKQHNQTRMQQFPYSREEKFLADETPLLKTLPKEDFQIMSYVTLTVGNNGCVYLAREKHYYSVPWKYVDKKVDLVITRSLIQIYYEKESIAIHSHARGGGYTTIKEHLASTHQHWSKRSPEYYIGLAGRRSAGLEALVKRIFQTEKTPELAYRTCDGLLSLQKKTDPNVFEMACEIAYNQDLFGYKRFKTIIAKCAEQMKEEKEAPKLPFHDNIRGKNSYK